MIILKKSSLKLPVQIFQSQQAFLHTTRIIYHEPVIRSHSEMRKRVVQLQLLMPARSPLNTELPV